MVYEPRKYRSLHKSGDLVSFEVLSKETDLYISAHSDLSKEAGIAIAKYRLPLEKYIAENPVFLSSLEPLPLEDNMPLVCRLMTEASAKVNVGPMAAVAGVIAELVGKDLLKLSPEVIVENGGDIFIKTDKPRIIGIYSGEESLFKGKLSIEISPNDSTFGVCTSSGTVGHSLSFGRADSVTILAEDAGLSDAIATAVGNLIQTSDDFPKAIDFAKRISGLNGLILVKNDKLGVWGKVKLC